ncbi:MAG: putative toxin-antitoxin system toxin component, PIN family [Ignavibacteriales bacterium CG_4_9_14_3_um_filter_30_11]|nr:MAG: putative toxin-antitoxin system toxin component, PIN family [Ignavibacteriales bacterium CG_4_9_14_3_um_filter_30_11]
MKIVIDSNIWISVFINKEVQVFITEILDKEVKIISSEIQVEEIADVLARPKLAKHISQSLIKEFLTLFLKAVEIVEIKITVNDCRDLKDNYILETALSGDADFIITADNDLLVLDPYRNLRIVTMQEFNNTFLI